MNKTPSSSSRLTGALWCFLRGHDWVSVRADNGRSILMRYECARCNAYRDMQYDYNIWHTTPHIEENR